MFRFENPDYLYLLILVPVLVLVRLYGLRKRNAQLKKFGDPKLLKALMPDVSRMRRELKFWLMMAAVVLLVVMLARPQMGTKINQEQRHGIEVVIALDISNSMKAEDVVPSRLDKSKMLVENLVDNFTNDKVGLVVFAGDAFVQLPITSDYVSAKMFLQNIESSLIAAQGTNLAEAISLSSRSFTKQENVGRAIIIITDGEDHEGGVIDAAKQAKKNGMRVFVLGVGSPKGSPVPDGNGGYMKDNTGREVMSALNEDMCKQMKEIPELAEKYKILIRYFENNFYADGRDVATTKQSVFTASAELDNLLRYPGVKNILCNRTNNLTYDSVLANGEVTFVCTRRGDLGANAHKAFGIFFLLLMQQSVLSRPGNDGNRIPHFLYIDDFPEFLCKAIEPIFTVYRKYKVGNILSAQTLSQLEGDEKGNFKDEILANCVNKAIFGNALPEDVQWWETELQEKREWKYKNSYETNSSKDNFGYDTKLGDISYGWTPNYKAGKIMSLKAKQVIFKVKDSKGKSVVGKGKLDYLEAKYKEPKKLKEYNFEKFTSGISDNIKKKPITTKFRGNFAGATSANDPEDFNKEIDPIQTDSTDSKYFLDNDDAIIFDLNRKNDNG